MKPPFERALTSAPGLDQRLDHVGVVLGSRPHQRGLTAQRLLRVDVGAVGQQRLDRRDSPVRAAVISAVSPSGSAVFGSAPAVSSRSMMAALPLMHASDERRHAVAVGRLDVGFRGQEQFDRCHVVALDRPVSAVVPSGSAALTSTRACEQLAHRRADRRGVPRRPGDDRAQPAACADAISATEGRRSDAIADAAQRSQSRDSFD